MLVDKKIQSGTVEIQFKTFYENMHMTVAPDQTTFFRIGD